MPQYMDGPKAGTVDYDPSIDPPAEELAMMAIGPGQDPGMGQGAQGGPPPQAGPPAGGGSPGSKFDQIMALAMEEAMSDGRISEDEKMIMQQIGTLVQKLKVNRKKQADQAISGSPTSPAVGQAYAGASV